MNTSDVCYFIVLAIVVLMMIYGFMDIIGDKPKTLKSGVETEKQVMARQLRGFGLLVLSQIILILGGMLCLGVGGFSINKMLSGLKLGGGPSIDSTGIPAPPPLPTSAEL